jgi:hypothetical protein
MQRIVIATLALSCSVYSAFGGGQPIKDAPSVIRVDSGKELKVLSITRTTLHGSDEPAVSVQYVSGRSRWRSLILGLVRPLPVCRLSERRRTCSL